MDYTFLQQYWWFLISLLGALLSFLLFVQGGQTVILDNPTSRQRELMLGSLAPKWELTFTTLVTFGGAFFASFPLFYSTSFGGALWVWMLILIGFVLQAVSYKYRLADNNLLGRKTYDFFLVFNGLTAPILISGAVGTFFFGSDFTIDHAGMLNTANPVINRWGDLHGLEVFANWRAVLFGLMMLFLTRTQANLWFINQIDDAEVCRFNRRGLIVNALLFVVLFLIVAVLVFTATGFTATGLHTFEPTPNKYLHNLTAIPPALPVLLIGVVLLLSAIVLTLRRPGFKRGIWLSGVGTVLAVLAIFWIAGYNNTPYYPSATDPQSSLTIANSSSSQFTLTTMTYVSFAIPFVLAYIVWVWRKLSKH